MSKRLIAIYDDAMFMYANKDFDELEHNDVCIVYNKDLDQFVPNIKIGSWTARMGPWHTPSVKQVMEMQDILDRLEVMFGE